jgi:hypothetical protein
MQIMGAVAHWSIAEVPMHNVLAGTRKTTKGGLEIETSQTALAQVIGTLGSRRRSANLLDSRENQTGKNADDCNHDEKFHQSKCRPRTAARV